jgi:hypothetical protein
MAKTKTETAPAAETPTETAAAATVAKQPTQNGVTRPREGTATGRVWQITDEIGAREGRQPTRKEVMEVGQAEGLNAATIATQYGRYRKFFGLGRETAAAAAPAPAETAPATAEASA